MGSAKWMMPFALVGWLLASGEAWAGELKIGVEPLETDAKGQLTEEGKAAAVTEVEAEPGDELWRLYLHAKLDRRAVEGPLYVEIYRERNGKQLVAYRKEYLDYDGALYVSMDLELERYDGFRPDQTVEIAFVQEIAGRTVKWSKASVTLRASSAPPPEPEEEEDDELEGEDEDEDELGEDEDEDEDEDEASAAPAEPAPPPSEPPPVTSGNTRGCHVGGYEPSAWLLLVVVLGARRRRARKA